MKLASNSVLFLSSLTGILLILLVPFNMNWLIHWPPVHGLVSFFIVQPDNTDARLTLSIMVLMIEWIIVALTSRDTFRVVEKNAATIAHDTHVVLLVIVSAILFICFAVMLFASVVLPTHNFNF